MKSLFNIYGKRTEKRIKFFDIFFSRSRKTSDERRSNLVVVRSEEAQSDAEIGKKMKKRKFFDKFEKR